MNILIAFLAGGIIAVIFGLIFFKDDDDGEEK